GDEACLDRAGADPAVENVSETPPSIAKVGIRPNLELVEFLSDGPFSVKETDGEGGKRETRIDLAGSTTAGVDKDGNEIETKYDEDGKVVEETTEYPDGSYTVWTRNEDGTSTATVWDKDDNLISTETRDENDRLMSSEFRNPDGTSVTARREPDGSVIMRRKDSDGRTLKTRTHHKDGDGYTDVDEVTGAKTVARRERDEEGEAKSIKLTTTNEDGTVERTATKDRIETVEKDKDGGVTARTIDDSDTGMKTRIEYDKDGKIARQVDTRKDGSSRDRWREEDGSEHGVICDDKGNVKEEFLRKKDGTTLRSKKTHWWDRDTIEYPDGATKEILEQKFGSKDRIVIEKDKDGKIIGHHLSSSDLLEPGQDYYEKQGGRDWHQLSPTEKAKYENAAEEAGPGPFGPPRSDYAKGVLERAKMRAEMEKDVDQLATDGRNGAADRSGVKVGPIGISPGPPAPEEKEDPAKRRAELEKKSREYSTRARELQKKYNQALEDGDRFQIRNIEAAMDQNMDDSLDVDSELAEMDARKTDPREAARYRISQAIRKDAAARAHDMNKLDAELEDHTQAVAGKFSLLSAGAEITTKTTDEARSADARRNLGAANLEAIERLEKMPGLLESKLGNLAQDKNALAAAKKFLADRKKFARNQVDMGTSERNTITAIRAAGVTADVLDTLIGGKIASGGGKAVSRGLKMAKGARATKVAPRLVRSGAARQMGKSSSRASSKVLPRSASRSAETLLDSAPFRTAGDLGETTLTDIMPQRFRQSGDTLDTLVEMWGQGGGRSINPNTRWVAIEELSERQLNRLASDSTILMPGPRIRDPIPVGALSDGISEATIRRLWEKGRNLTREELLIKIDRILDGADPATGLMPR
ncbi:MAG: hypothetical protein JSV91_04165, partial [Phycisphaerales bacterium]